MDFRDWTRVAGNHETLTAAPLDGPIHHDDILVSASESYGFKQSLRWRELED